MTMYQILARATLAGALCVFLMPALAAAETGYQQPSDNLVDVIDAPATPWVSISPDEKSIMLMHRPNLPPITELAEEELRLAGTRIKPATNGPSRGWSANGLTLLQVDDQTRQEIAGLPDPADTRISNLSWSPDGSRISFLNTTSTGIELWVVEVADREARRIIGPRLNLAAGNRPRWLSDNRRIVCALVEGDRGPAPEKNQAPAGPTTQENLGKTAPARTYQDLLKNAHDEALYDYYFTAQIAVVDLDGTITEIGKPAVFTDVDPAPDGVHLLVEWRHRPYSYTLPASRFPRTVQIWNLDGELIHEVAEKPLQDAIPIAFGSTETGPRSFQWRSDAPATLVWAEAQDGGDAGAEAEIRDLVFTLDAPFKAAPDQLASLGQRFGGTTWGTGDLAMVTSWWWQTRNLRVWKVAPDGDMEQTLLREYSFEDRYADPGEPVMRLNESGRRVIKLTGDGKSMFMIGDGASDEGDRPFLDRYDIETGETTRLYRSQAPQYSMPIEVLDDEGQKILVRHESVESPPNYFIRDLDSGDEVQVTEFAHPTPQLLGVQKEIIRYARADDVMLTGTLYLPAGYDAAQDGPLPVLMWAYPQEYKSADAAGQVTDSPYRFVRVGWWSPLLYLLQGYAVLDDPAMPIVGEGDEEPNDTFIEQLVSSAQAAADELVRRGVGDRDRMAIGGHSYGAFMTANLLAHSDIFAAGIARSGAYNRTLTPFGFQAEERDFWEAPEIYFSMSPFMHAEKVNEPILLIHGEADNNSGTFPMQSERYFAALKGNGATARLVMLPYESHGYRARESILHMIAEQEIWLDTWVKGEPLPDGLQRAPANPGER
jgi:dipeptidyl aminopeptidase/acylaminoacyl peptidase